MNFCTSKVKINCCILLDTFVKHQEMVPIYNHFTKQNKRCTFNVLVSVNPHKKSLRIVSNPLLNRKLKLDLIIGP